MTDDELVSGFLGGDRSAFTHLMERHEDRVYALAYRLTGNRQDALGATLKWLAARRGSNRGDT